MFLLERIVGDYVVDLRFVVAVVPIEMSSQLAGEHDGDELCSHSGDGPKFSQLLLEVLPQDLDEGFLNFRLAEEIVNRLSDLVNSKHFSKPVFGKRCIKLSIRLGLLLLCCHSRHHANQASDVSGNVVLQRIFQSL